MSAAVEVKPLAVALAAFAPLVRKSPVPIVECVRLELHEQGLTITGTDLDVEMSLDVAAEVGESLVAVVPFVRLRQFVAALPRDGEVALALRDENLSLKSAASRCQLLCMDAAGWPGKDRSGDVAAFDVDAAELRSVVAFCSDAVSGDERPYLSGLFIDARGGKSPLAVATNGHQLACRPIAVLAGKIPAVDAPVPASALALAAKAEGPVRVTLDAERIELAWAGGRVLSKVIDGSFPDWQRAIPKLSNSAKTNGSSLREALTRVTAGSGTRFISLSLSKRRIQIHGRNEFNAAMEAASSIECSATSSVVVGLNANYLDAALAALSADNELLIEWSSATEPFRLTAGGEASRIVVPRSGVDESVFERQDESEAA